MLSFTLPTAANILNNRVQKAWKEQQSIQTLRTCHLIISSAAYLGWEQLTCSVSQLRYELQACSFLKVLGKTIIWCENSSPKSTDFSAPCSRTSLDPMPFGNFPHPQKHLCTDMQAAHLPWTSSNNAHSCTEALKAQQLIFHWYLLPCRADAELAPRQE